MKRDLADIFIGAGKLQEVERLVDGAVSELGKDEAAEATEWLREPLSDLRAEFLKSKQNINDNSEEAKTGIEVLEKKVRAE
jgi:hypothetical protein